MKYLGYTIIERFGIRGTYYMWKNGLTGKNRAELGFFSNLNQVKESIRIHITTGRYLTESDPEIKDL